MVDLPHRSNVVEQHKATQHVNKLAFSLLSWNFVKPNFSLQVYGSISLTFLHIPVSKIVQAQSNWIEHGFSSCAAVPFGSRSEFWVIHLDKWAKLFCCSWDCVHFVMLEGEPSYQFFSSFLKIFLNVSPVHSSIHPSISSYQHPSPHYKNVLHAMMLTLTFFSIGMAVSDQHNLFYVFSCDRLQTWHIFNNVHNY